MLMYAEAKHLHVSYFSVCYFHPVSLLRQLTLLCHLAITHATNTNIGCCINFLILHGAGVASQGAAIRDIHAWLWPRHEFSSKYIVMGWFCLIFLNGLWSRTLINCPSFLDGAASLSG